MHNGCDIANQMFSNGQLWNLTSHFRNMLNYTAVVGCIYMVIFVIFFPGMLNSSSIFFYKVNSLGIGTKWRQQDPGKRTIKTSGILWTDEYLQVVMTSQNVDLQELPILLKEGGGGGIQTHFSDKYLKYFLWNSYQVNTTPHWSLVNNGSGNGLVPSSNKPLHEPMFTQISGAIWRH